MFSLSHLDDWQVKGYAEELQKDVIARVAGGDGDVAGTDVDGTLSSSKDMSNGADEAQVCAN